MRSRRRVSGNCPLTGAIPGGTGGAVSKEDFVRNYDQSEEASRVADYSVCPRCNRSIQMDENGKRRLHGVYVLGRKVGFRPCQGKLQ